MDKQHGHSMRDEAYFDVEIDGVKWEADNCSSYAIKNDDGESYSVTLEAERSAMDMDPSNKGWLIRFYLTVPKSQLREMQGTYPIGGKGEKAQAYLLLGENETLSLTGQLQIKDAAVRLEGNGVAVDRINGSFKITTNQGKSVTGDFLIK